MCNSCIAGGVCSFFSFSQKVEWCMMLCTTVLCCAVLLMHCALIHGLCVEGGKEWAPFELRRAAVDF